MENKKYKITGKIEILTEEGVKTGKFLPKGSIQDIPTELGDEWVKNGVATLVEDKPANSPVESKVTSVKVYTKDNQVIREYTKAMHGEDFIKLAKGFAVKHGYSLK